MMHAIKVFLFVLPLGLLSSLIYAAGSPDLPSEAPNDGIMASPEAVAAMADWAVRAFTGKETQSSVDSVKVQCRRQDHNELRFNQSCMQTPIKIGQQSFEHGLGTHANSEIAVSLPAAAKAFQAMVGIDNNYDTAGVHGTVQFSVEIGGKEVFRTATLKGGDAPVAVNVAIPEGTKELVLKVDTTPDGPSHDQADWAEAAIVLTNGKQISLSSTSSFIDYTAPFSFRYNGAESGEFLKTWKRTVETKELSDRVQHQVTWTDPKTSLQVTAVAGSFKRFPAVDWVLSFENLGKEDTPIIENIQALDANLQTNAAKQPATLHRLTGDNCNETSFLPYETALPVGQTIAMASSGGRPSNTTAFPFFNYQYANQGVITAIGWSGQWAASLNRSAAGPTRLQAGMEKTHLVLHPGEKIRSPRILLMTWTGDRMAAHQRFRRLLMFHYVPKQGDRPLALPFAAQCFDRYFSSGSHPGWATEAGQIAAAKVSHQVGCDYHWLDAAWFPLAFPNGVGNWSCDPKKFPKGMKPVTDACHQMGLKFILWFEPERVAKDTQIAKEHPEFVFGGAEGGLFKLNDPKAQRWLTDHLSGLIGEYGLDVYRNDFNIDPLGFWQKNDTPDRQGMTEIRYVEGHYAMWDEFLAKHPGLWIDNCASGGRRIDLETCMRSAPLWRSDASCSPGHPAWNQTETQGLSLYIPLFTACCWIPNAYDMRSAATGGLICQFDYLNEQFPMEEAKKALSEVKENRKYWYGDYYPLTAPSLSEEPWAAYQFHRADLNAGIVLAFHRNASPYSAMTVNLGAIDPAAKYHVELIDEARQKVEKTIPGSELANEFELRLPKKQSSMLVRYRKIGG
jgi:alpha-galactosidase